jgi:hypothetical protein
MRNLHRGLFRPHASTRSSVNIRIRTMCFNSGVERTQPAFGDKLGNLSRLYRPHSTLTIHEPDVNLDWASNTDKSIFIGFSMHRVTSIGLAESPRIEKVFFNEDCTILSDAWTVWGQHLLATIHLTAPLGERDRWATPAARRVRRFSAGSALLPVYRGAARASWQACCRLDAIRAGDTAAALGHCFHPRPA